MSGGRQVKGVSIVIPTDREEQKMLTLRYTHDYRSPVDYWLHLMEPDNPDNGDVYIQVTDAAPNTIVAGKVYTMVDADLHVESIDLDATLRIVAEPGISHDNVARTIVGRAQQAVELALAEWGLSLVSPDPWQDDCTACGKYQLLVPGVGLCVPCLAELGEK